MSEPQDVAAILNAAADLIEPAGKWTQRAAARHSNGFPIGWYCENAACFCMVGALRRATDSDARFEAAYAALSAFVPSPASWNDQTSRTQAEVVATLRSAASQAQGAGI